MSPRVTPVFLLALVAMGGYEIVHANNISLASPQVQVTGAIGVIVMICVGLLVMIPLVVLHTLADIPQSMILKKRGK